MERILMSQIQDKILENQNAFKIIQTQSQALSSAQAKLKE
jgi:hypothetical protein